MAKIGKESANSAKIYSLSKSNALLSAPGGQAIGTEHYAV